MFYVNDGLNLRTYTGYTGVELITTNSDVEFVSSIMEIMEKCSLHIIRLFQSIVH